MIRTFSQVSANNLSLDQVLIFIVMIVGFIGILGAVIIHEFLEHKYKGHKPLPFPSCGHCRYDVHELTTMTCPECGKDLRQVGIIPATPKKKRWPFGRRDEAAKRTSSAPASPRTVTRTATILLTDMRDYTARFAGSSRDEAMALLRRQRDVVQPIVQRRGGQIIKSTGDGLIVSFESATDALLAAGEIQAQIDSLNRQAFADKDKFQLRIAVATGEVAFLDNDVFGHPVNLASRLQQLAEPGQVCFSESTFHSMNRSEVACETLGLMEIKGLSDKVNVYRMSRTTPVPASPAQT